MQTTIIATETTQHPFRNSGSHTIAFDVTTPSGKTGTALFYCEYDRRDLMDEVMWTSPEIADEIKEAIGEDSPQCMDCFTLSKEIPVTVEQWNEIKKNTNVVVFDMNGHYQ